MTSRRLRSWSVLALLLCARAAAADQLPPALDRLLHYEQKLLSREVDLHRISGTVNLQDPKFAPEQAGHFTVKSYWIDAAKMNALTGEGLPSSTRALFFRQRDGVAQVRLLVHPESERFYQGVVKHAERGEDFMASATASSRTLLAWPKGRPEQAMFAKLSLDKEIGNVVRTIPGSEVARSIGINNVLSADRAALPDSFRFLPEVIGAIPKGMDRGGMIIRTIPEELLSGKAHYIPLFSLYAEPKGGGAPIIVDMIRRSGQDPASFVTERILRPFVKQWSTLVHDHHAVMEPHAQNVLLEVGHDGLPTGRFLHRDLGGFRVDLAARQQGRLPQAATPLINDRARDYKEESFADNLSSSLNHYFDGGFVHNLDGKLPGWIDRYGLGRSFQTGTLHKNLLHAVEDELQARTGEPARLEGSFWRLGGLLARSRAQAQARSAAPLGTRGSQLGDRSGSLAARWGAKLRGALTTRRSSPRPPRSAPKAPQTRARARAR